MSERGLRENGTGRHRATGGGESPGRRRSRAVGGSRIHRTARGGGFGVAAPPPWLAGARQWGLPGAEPRGGAGARDEAAFRCGTAGAADQRWTMADGRGDGKGAMVEQTVTREFVVGLAKGLHLRPADMLAREARRWRSRVEVIANRQRVDGKSILDVMTLAVESGSRVAIEVTGPDASEALDAIGGLFARNFDETGGGDEADGEPSAPDAP
ncbi:MAG: HPr family phosphocarrier protein [Planctomycetes bacterium]|nr:HPr family phosphocarrier protein [Planctomycetota bacterium]